ncbi:unnamed protein product [Caenorhabditis bovis]|uniref:Saposin B-type domain-containing protein n=1 Tax=Caenorhabditis bovis TaxID=2654633 RepID=A0A8S1FAB7_9PELO|nr:unnamed protein product [Caenorhabditis bovis]
MRSCVLIRNGMKLGDIIRVPCVLSSSFSSPSRSPPPLLFHQCRPRSSTCVATVKAIEGEALHEGDVLGKKEVNAICLKVVPVPAAEHLCESYGDKEVDVIVAELKKDVPPKDICKKMNKC